MELGLKGKREEVIIQINGFRKIKYYKLNLSSI